MMIVKLVCKSVWYYSAYDEDAFFEWLKKIPAINKFDGQGDELYLYCTSSNIADDDLRELLALFYRYKVKMTQLNVFLNDQNKEWFYDNKESFFYKKVFGSEKGKQK